MPSKRLFEKEADNQHEDTLHLAQLAAKQVAQILARGGNSCIEAAGEILSWAVGAAKVGLLLLCSSPCMFLVFSRQNYCSKYPEAHPS